MMRGDRGYEHDRVKSPENLRDVSRYLKELLGGFFVRFGYTVSLVWGAGPWILILMCLLALLKGVAPVVGSLISKEILNELHSILSAGGVTRDDFWQSPVLYLLVFLFASLAYHLSAHRYAHLLGKGGAAGQADDHEKKQGAGSCLV